MWWFFLWILSICVTVVVASKKGRSPLLWGGICIFLGPIGALFAFMMPRNDEAIEERLLKSGTMRKCPTCAELIRADAKICRYCGSQIPEESSSIALPEWQGKSIHQAVAECNFGEVSAMIDAGADVNAKDEYGRTPLDIARSQGDHLIEKLLLSHGAQP